MYNKKNYQVRGQLTLELVIALGILTLGISGLVFVIFGNQSLLVDTQESNQALNLARQNLENAYAQAQEEFGSLENASSTQGEYLIERSVLDIDTYTKEVTSRVSWQTTPLRPQEIELVARITDWRSLRDSGDDTGGGDPFGDWKCPETLGTINIPNISGTDLDTVNKIIYLTAEASDKKKNDLVIVDANNPSSLNIISSIDTGDSLKAIDVAGNYAYVAHDKTSAQLQVIDVSNLSAPTTTAEFTLPGVSGPNAVGKSVFYSNGKVYMGTGNANGPEFHIVDVSNPQNPSSLGSYEVGGDVNAIHVAGNTAYLAISVDGQELLILDIGNPSAISQISTFNAPGTSDGKSVYLTGTTLYLGRISGSGSELYILDVSNPGSVQQLGVQTVNADINGVVAKDRLVFLGTTESNSEFQVWDALVPSSTVLWSTFNYPQVATGMDYEDNLVYTSVRSNEMIRIITSKASCP